MSAHLLVWTCSIAVLVVHRFLLANRRPVWLGAIAPALWLLAVAVLVQQGRVTDGRGGFALFAGLVVLLGLWIEGQESWKRRLKREDERIDALNARGGAVARSTP